MRLMKSVLMTIFFMRLDLIVFVQQERTGFYNGCHYKALNN